MKIKTRDLIGPALDWAVAKCEVVLPSNCVSMANVVTPGGRRVMVCPQSRDARVTCSTCGICQKSGSERPIVGFPAHGTKKRLIDQQLAA